MKPRQHSTILSNYCLPSQCSSLQGRQSLCFSILRPPTRWSVLCSWLSVMKKAECRRCNYQLIMSMKSSPTRSSTTHIIRSSSMAFFLLHRSWSITFRTIRSPWLVTPHCQKSSAIGMPWVDWPSGPSSCSPMTSSTSQEGQLCHMLWLTSWSSGRKPRPAPPKFSQNIGSCILMAQKCWLAWGLEFS